MITANYRTMPDLIATLTPFKHGSCHAVLEGDVYTVYSYSTPIARASKLANGEFDATLNPQKYSMTTSRLQNIIRKAWGF